MFGFKKELYTPEYQLAGDECAVIETSKGTIKVKFDGEAPHPRGELLRAFHDGFFTTALSSIAMCPGFVIQGGDPQYPRYVRRRCRRRP